MVIIQIQVGKNIVEDVLLYGGANVNIIIKNLRKKLGLPKPRPILTHSQLLEGLKCDSQTDNCRRVRSQGTLPSSQHFGRVDKHVGALGWDYEKLTSFSHSHGPAQNQHKVVNA